MAWIYTDNEQVAKSQFGNNLAVQNRNTLLENIISKRTVQYFK